MARSLQLAHWREISGNHGLFEHARYSRPRYDHGYCLDDNARALVVICRAASCGIDFPTALRNKSFEYVMEASRKRVWRNRLSVDGVWERGSSDDAIGRGIWGLGVAAGWWPEEDVRARAQKRLRSSFGFESHWWHPRAYAVLGVVAAHQATNDPNLTDEIARLARPLPRPRPDSSWIWPEPRLRYDNARLPEALIAAGSVLDDRAMVADGLSLLRWLVEQETGGWGFSFTPAEGRGPDDRQPAFDQQPLEAWAMADAAIRAAEVSGDSSWMSAAHMAVSWFVGRNDHQLDLYDSESGGCFDGLTENGVNLNQGAESTLSALGTLLALLKPIDTP